MKIGRKHFAAFAALTSSACIAIGAVHAVAQYQEEVANAGQLQRAEARVVATRIAAYLDKVAMQVQDVASLPWSPGLLDEGDRQNELYRLLRLNPAVYEAGFVAADGRERYFVSRLAPDKLSSDSRWPLADLYLTAQRPRLWYGPVYFREGSTPYVSLAARTTQTTDVLVAEINLQYVTDLIATIQVGASGRAYVVGPDDRLIAHANPSLVHRNLSLANLPQVTNARARSPRDLAIGFTVTARSPETQSEVVTSAVSIDAPRWLVFVEQPLSEVMAPVYASVYRTLALLCALLVAGLVISRYLAARLTRPIVELESGASRIAYGDFSARVTASRDDEVASLALEFNRMAENVERSHQELEDKVRARTGELADAAIALRARADEVASLNQQLRMHLAELATKKDDAERANSAKTRFIAAASHDLRQPMQAVSLLVEVLHGRITDPEANGLVDKIQASVQALETLFVSLLDISRLDAGVVQPEIQDFQVGLLLRRIEANFVPQAVAKGLRLTVVHSHAVVRSDPVWLERVLSNLVSNAVRYTVRGHILLGCRMRGESLRILVMDTGPGIPARFHDDIFEEFFQLANPERDRSKGLGLGLSIVKRTAEILGHPLILKSEVNHGSTFGIEVPRVATGVAPSARSRFSVPDPKRLTNTFVLVIGDDKDSRFALETLCRQWGCHVASASSGETAVAQLDKHLRVPDLIISDFRLQRDETGLDVIAAVRRTSEDDIPAILMTGDTSVRALGLSRHVGVALLYKPINAETLWRAADKLLSKSTQSR